jgi:hypothetical protein
MIEPHVHIAFAPRGAGLLCALLYYLRDDHVLGWFTGARAHEFPASFFMLEHYYATRETVTYRSVQNDVYGDWLIATHTTESRIDPPVPVPERECHELERLQDAFAHEWLFYADDPAHAAEAAALRERELAVLPVNVRPRKLAKLATGQPVWTFSSPGCDAHVVRYLAKRWRIDYEPA